MASSNSDANGTSQVHNRNEFTYWQEQDENDRLGLSAYSNTADARLLLDDTKSATLGLSATTSQMISV